MDAEYLTDTPYTWGFYGDFAPMNLGYVARLSGLVPVDPTRPFRFLELGCGNGVSLTSYAACHPESEFHGVDLNPEHVANARRLAEDARLPNVRFHEASFADFLGDESGPFDLVAVHGVYSWVGPDVRRDIRDVIDQKLRPGGYAYVSYNAMPGWAPLLPLRQMMLAYTAGMEMPTIERVRRGLQYLKHLRDSGAAYFVNNTAAHQRLDSLLQYDPHYVAHEFFPKHWNAFYFEEVARDLRECGLAFAGNVPASLNIRELSVPQKFRDLLETARTRAVYETHKSFVLNETFRRDVYVKTPSVALDPDPIRSFGEVVFGPLVEPGEVQMKRKFPVGEVAYSGPIYPVLTEVLNDGARRFADLCADARLAPFEPLRILHSLHLLCGGGQFAPLLAPLRERPAARRNLRFAHPIHRALLLARLVRDGRVSLPSPVTGGGIAVDLLVGLAALAHDHVPEEASGEWALDFLEQRGQKLQLDGRPVEGRETQLAVLKERFLRFRQASLPRLAQFGVVDPY